MSNARDDHNWINSSRERTWREPVSSQSEEMGAMHFSTENFSTALEYFHEALQAPGVAPYPDKFRILLRISDCHVARGSFEDADRFLGAAEALADASDTEYAAKLAYRKSSVRYRRGQYQEALRVGFEAFRQLKHSNSHLEVADIQLLLANCYHRLGMLPEAEEYFSDALATYRRIDHQPGVSFVYNNLGILHKLQCRWARSLSCHQKALEIAQTLGMGQQVLSIQLNIGSLHFRQRQYAEASSAFAVASAGAERMGDHLKHAKALCMIGRTCVHTGDFGRAGRNLMRAQALASEMGYAREEALIDEYLGELMLARRQYREARANLLSALVAGRKIAPDGDIVAEVLRRLAEVEFHLGDPEAALRYIEEGSPIAEKCERFELGFYERIRARALERSERTEDAIAAADSSLKAFAESDNIFERAVTLRLAARLRMRHELAGGAVRARQELVESVAAFSRLDECAQQVTSLVLLAALERRLGNHDDALLAVCDAESIVEESHLDKFRPAVRALRTRIESRMTSATTQVVDQFSILGEIQSNARSRESLSSGVSATLRMILDRIGGAGGFVAIPSEGGRTLSVIAREGIGGRDAQSVATWFSRGQVLSAPKAAMVISEFESSPEWQDLAQRLNGQAGAVVLQGLGFDEESLGVLCIVRETGHHASPIAQDTLNFVAAYASLISLSAYELIRNERRGSHRTRRSERAPGFEHIVTENVDMLRLLNLAERVAQSNATVLLQGETGTGKGLIAYAVHLLSERRDRKFVHVNCAALPEQLLESELFGHVRGAFTGAHADKEGLLSLANGGTVFLDEIGKTSLTMQGKLLQFLDNSKVRKVGANDYVYVDVRVICASKNDLLSMVHDGRFLEDFFYRINDFPLVVPPLRDRAEDISLLLDHYLEKISREMVRDIPGATDAFIERLGKYGWPGNVRELEKVVKRAIILADDGDMLDLIHLAPEVLSDSTPGLAKDMASEMMTLRERIERLEEAEIARVLDQTDGNKSRAAAQLGISYPNLLSKIKRYNIQ